MTGQARHRHHRLRQHLHRLLPLAPLFRGLEVRACTDINLAAAEARAKEFGVEAQTVDALLANPDVDVVINLTIPDAHYGVTATALEAGKHVYSEKPFVLTVDEGLQLKALADAQGPARRLARRTPSSAARTSYARKLVDDGAHRHRHRRHRPRDVATAWSTGTRTRTSSSCPAPARCSTSAPTTSPTSST